MKTLKYKHFQYSEQLCDFCNDNKIRVVSITTNSKFVMGGEGYTLFYY